MLGSTFANFQVLEKIGQGGTADIYVVNDQTGQRYALRVLRAEHRYNWRRIWRFRRECVLLELFDHPNIVHGFGHGKFRGQRYSIREYVEGGNLKDRILRSDPQVQVHRLKLLTGMATGLAHIHEHGYMHLDFKPENVLVTAAYEPKIVDFELCTRRPDRPKRIGKMPGTPAYLAPEQIARQPIDERVDIFAYGVTAYEMLTGKKPVTGNTVQEVLQKYARFDEHLKPLHTHVPTIPPNIERVVLKCLEKDPDRRYPAMSLVVRDLQS
jgi:serine/threonine-protein kinase